MPNIDWYKVDDSSLVETIEDGLRDLEQMKEIIIAAHNYLIRKIQEYDLFHGLDDDSVDDVIHLCKAVESGVFTKIVDQVDILFAANQLEI